MAVRDEWRWRLRVGAAVGLWFWIVYGGADWLTGLRAAQSPLPSVRIAADDAIPFWPFAAWIYMTVTPALLLPLLLLPDRSSIRALAWALASEICLAGLIYLILPVAPTHMPDVALPAIMRLADEINLTFNSVPSLHVALALTSTLAMQVPGQPLRNAALALWAASIAVSTLLTHQHLIIDVAAGVFLAGLGFALFRRIAGAQMA